MELLKLIEKLHGRESVEDAVISFKKGANAEKKIIIYFKKMRMSDEKIIYYDQYGYDVKKTILLTKDIEIVVVEGKQQGWNDNDEPIIIKRVMKSFIEIALELQNTILAFENNRKSIIESKNKTDLAYTKYEELEREEKKKMNKKMKKTIESLTEKDREEMNQFLITGGLNG